MKKLKCASFFAGVGDIDLGFESTNAFKVIYSNEIDELVVKTYELNFMLKLMAFPTSLFYWQNFLSKYKQAVNSVVVPVIQKDCYPN